MRTIQLVACFILLSQGLYSHATTVADADLGQLAIALQGVDKLEASGNTAAAITQYESLIKRYPQQPALYNNLAVLLAKTGELDVARERLEQALQVDKVYATVYENLTAVYVEMARGSYAKALQLGVSPQQVNLKEVELAMAQAPALALAPAQNTATAATAQPVAEIAVTDNASAASVLQPAEDKNIRMTLQGWASAWSAQEVDLYLSFYAADFQPEKGISRARWEQQRSQRLRRPAWVKITLDDFKLELAEDGLARVRFLQHYQSDNYRDKTHKELLLKSSSEGWRILSERSL